MIAILLYLIRFIIEQSFSAVDHGCQQNPTASFSLFLLEFIQPLFNGYVHVFTGFSEVGRVARSRLEN